MKSDQNVDSNQRSKPYPNRFNIGQLAGGDDWEGFLTLFTPLSDHRTIVEKSVEDQNYNKRE